jgi:hypothetical protein
MTGNYGGDRMNFDMAGELLAGDGIETTTVLGNGRRGERRAGRAIETARRRRADLRLKMGRGAGRRRRGPRGRDRHGARRSR